MQLSQESYRTRWLVLVTVWTLTAAGLFMQTGVVKDYLDLASGLALRGAAAPSTPLQQMFPGFAADGQTWVRHAISLTEGNGPQLRYTTIDNAPQGREVHWNSAWAWTIAAAGKVHQLFTGLPLPNAIERASVWLNPAVHVLLIVILSAWVTKRAGLLAGLIVVAAMACTDRMFEGFFPTYVDHHGLLTVAVFAMMLGAVFMGGGWWQPADGVHTPLLPTSPELARSSAIFSAVAGAIGLWVSAASVIPPIALVAAAGLLTVVVQGRTAQSQGAVFDPMVWRIWGRAGAIASAFFYLVEYFPTHLGLRLETNHPLHALAWLGGGELLAQISQRWLGAKEARWTEPLTLAWPVAVSGAGVAALLIAGPKAFGLFDPFMSNLHNTYIQEFLPIWVTVRHMTAKMVFQLLAIDNLPMIAAIATLSYRRRESPLVLWFATFAALFFNAMGWWQSRWLLNASGVQITAAMVVLGVWVAPQRAVWRWVAVLALVGVFYIPTAVIRYQASKDDVAARRAGPKEASLALMRDVAAAIRASQSEGEITVLSSPNASTAIGYYGRFKTIGTLYWENAAGLKTAARILSARTDDEAAKLIKEHKITHVAMVMEENFIGAYQELLNPNDKAAQTASTFGRRLLFDKSVPQWLQMIPYKAPDDVAAVNQGVLLFKVNFEQSLPDALYNVGMALATLDALADAERTFELLITQFPELSQPWIRKGEILFRRHNWDGALNHLVKGISLSPAGERAKLYSGTAHLFYTQGLHAIAIQVYRRSLAEGPNSDAACYLAWVLATSREDNLRNAAESLELAQQALKANPNSPTYLNTLAAALAESGRIPEAVAVADRALANARVQGQNDAVKATEQNLATLRAGSPIRR